MKVRFFFLSVFFMLNVFRGHAEEVQKQPFLFYHESYGHKDIEEFIEENDFDEYILTGDAEFEQMMLLKGWVFRHLKYDLAFASQDILDARSVMDKTRDGTQFLCTNYCSVFMQAAVSMGWTARFYFVKKQTGEQHTVCDIWSNEYSKWIFVDPTWNVHLEKNGMPLSILEARDEFYKNGGNDLTYVFGSGKRVVRFGYQDLPYKIGGKSVWAWYAIDKTWLGYLYQIALVGRNDFFNRKGPGGVVNLWDSIYIIRDDTYGKEAEWPFKGNRPVENPDDFYFGLNRVRIEYTLETGKMKKNSQGKKSFFKPVNIKIESDKNSYTPNFSNFMVRVNGGRWEKSLGNMKTTLHPGKNRVYACARNKFGIFGPVEIVEITVHEDKQKTSK